MTLRRVLFCFCFVSCSVLPPAITPERELSRGEAKTPFSVVTYLGGEVGVIDYGPSFEEYNLSKIVETYYGQAISSLFGRGAELELDLAIKLKSEISDRFGAIVRTQIQYSFDGEKPFVIEEISLVRHAHAKEDLDGVLAYLFDASSTIFASLIEENPDTFFKDEEIRYSFKEAVLKKGLYAENRLSRQKYRMFEEKLAEYTRIAKVKDGRTGARVGSLLDDVEDRITGEEDEKLPFTTKTGYKKRDIRKCFVPEDCPRHMYCLTPKHSSFGHCAFKGN